MSHEIETIAYSGEEPWHGLGIKVPADLTPAQMQEAAGLNWTVDKVPLFGTHNGKKHGTGKSGLFRASDSTLLDVVSDDWNVVQNDTAFEFFNDFVAAGDMEMHTAGSLKNGQIVWALAKIKESFEVVKDDVVDSYMLFTNPHKYGWATSVSFTGIRVVCMNTLRLSLGSANSDKIVKVHHHQQFNSDDVKVLMGISHEKLQTYKEMAQFLASKKAKKENVIEYFNRVFPMTSKNSQKETSRNATIAMDLLEKQPGAEFAAGTWWQPANSVTYMFDHLIGHNADNRLTNSWYGSGRKTKIDAMKLAVEMAQAA